MKLLGFTCILLLLISCAKNEEQFDSVPCELNEGNSENLRKIYQPCREYIYRARYWDQYYNLISDEKIWMMATGRVWEYNESQDEIAIQYLPDLLKRDFIEQFNLNPEYQRSWREGEVAGIVENEREVWMHPFQVESIHLH